MAILPIYKQQRNIQETQSGSYRQGEAAAMSQSHQNLIGTMGKIAQAFSDAHDVTQTNEVKDNTARKIARIRDAWSKDSGRIIDKNGDVVFTDNSAFYQGQISDVVKNSVKDVDNRQLANALSFEMANLGYAAVADLQADIRTKYLDYSKGRVQDNSIRYTADMLSPDERVRSRARQERDMLYRDSLVSGIIDDKFKRELEEDSLNTVMRWKIYADQETIERDFDDNGNSTLLNQLRDTSKGSPYSWVDPGKRIGYIKELTARIASNNKINKQETVRTQVNNRIQFLKDVAAKKVDPSNPSVIDSMYLSDPDFADILKTRVDMGSTAAFLTYGGKNAFALNQAFVSGVESVYQQKTEEELHGLIADVTVSAGDSLRGLNKLGILVDTLAAQAALLSEQQSDPQLIKDHQDVETMLFYIENSLGLSSDDVVDTKSNFLEQRYRDKSSGDKIKQDAFEAILNTVHQQYPKTRLLPSIPNKVTSKDDLPKSLFLGPNELNGDSYAPSEPEPSGSKTKDSSGKK